jgi:hypothetical protein
VVGTDDDILWNDSEEDGMLGVWGRWRWWLWRWIEWHRLVKVDRILHALCIKCMTLIAQFFRSSFIFARVVLDMNHISIQYSVCYHDRSCFKCMPPTVTVQDSRLTSLAVLALAMHFRGAINSSKPQGYGIKQGG